MFFYRKIWADLSNTWKNPNSLLLAPNYQKSLDAFFRVTISDKWSENSGTDGEIRKPGLRLSPNFLGGIFTLDEVRFVFYHSAFANSRPLMKKSIRPYFLLTVLLLIRYSAATMAETIIDLTDI